MTTKEAIAVLAKLPQDNVFCVRCADFGYGDDRTFVVDSIIATEREVAKMGASNTNYTITVVEVSSSSFRCSKN